MSSHGSIAMCARFVLVAVVLVLRAPELEAQKRPHEGTLGQRRRGDVTDFVVAPDGERLVFQVAPVDAASVGLQLFATQPNPGQELVQLGDGIHQPCLPLPTCARLDPYLEISSDHSRAVYRALGANGHDLFSAPIDGGARALLASDAIQAFEVTADALRVVYSLEFGAGSRLFSVPIDGSQAPIQLSAPGHTLVFSTELALTPDGQRVAYTTGSGIYVVRVDGSEAPLELASAGTQVASEVGVAPDGLRVVFYLHDGGFGSQDFDLYSVPIDASAGPVQLNPALAPGHSVLPGRHAFTPDGGRVLYLADQDVNGEIELFSVPSDGSATSVQLNAPLAAGADVFEYEVDPLGVRVAFTVADVNEHSQLYSVPAAGGQSPVLLNGAMVAGGSIAGAGHDWFRIAGGGARVVYVADQETNDVFELFSAPLDGSASAKKLSGAMTVGGDVGGNPAALFEPPFRLALDGTRVAYVADAATNDVFELFGALLDGSAPAERLSGVAIPGADVSFAIGVSADGRVLYRADSVRNDVFELFSVPIDGSAGPERLNGGLGDWGG